MKIKSWAPFQPLSNKWASSEVCPLDVKELSNLCHPVNPVVAQWICKSFCMDNIWRNVVGNYNLCNHPLIQLEQDCTWRLDPTLRHVPWPLASILVESAMHFFRVNPFTRDIRETNLWLDASCKCVCLLIERRGASCTHGAGTGPIFRTFIYGTWCMAGLTMRNKVRT